MSLLTPDETLLGLLARRAQHGYDLRACFADPDQLGRVWRLSTSQIYNVLKRLETDALIVGRAVAVANAPPRVEYALTDAGRARLHAWLYNDAPSSSIRRVRVEFVSRLFIAQSLELAREPIVQRQSAALERERTRLIADRRAAASEMEALTLDFVIAQINAALTWIAGIDSR